MLLKLAHGVNKQTFASWIQKRRRNRGDYENEEIRKKLRMRKQPSSQKSQAPAMLNFIELNTSATTDSAHQALEIMLVNGISVKLQSVNQIPLLKILIKELGC